MVFTFRQNNLKDFLNVGFFLYEKSDEKNEISYIEF